MHKWYVVQVFSGHEKKVKKALEENRELHGMNEDIEQIVLPVENISEVKQGQQKVTEKRVWPGYLLVRMNINDISWQYVKNTASVLDFLGGGKPTPLAEEEVAEILKDLADKQERVIQRHKFEVGDNVKITEGVFVNFTGTVIEVFHEKGRLSVLVSIFGRDTRVDDLDFAQVEQWNDDDQSASS